MIKKDKDGKTTIFCIRGNAKMTKRELESIQTPTPVLGVSCANGEHEDGGGEGCECDCKHKLPEEL